MLIDSLLHLFQGETQDLLFIATEKYKFCVLQWDSESSELITRYIMPWKIKFNVVR